MTYCEGEEMKAKKISKVLIILLTLSMVFSSCGSKTTTLEEEMHSTGKLLFEYVQNPTVSNVGGGWAIIALAKSETEVPDNYYDGYYDDVMDLVKNTKGEISKVSLDYSRVTLAVLSIGKDPTNISGYNIARGLNDFETVKKEGNESIAYALLAANEADTKLKDEDQYIEALLKSQDSDGGFQNEDGDGKLDVTPIVIEALSDYNNNSKVDKAIDKSVQFLATSLDKNGSLGDCEKTSKAIVALNIANKFNDNISLDILLKGLEEYRVKDGYVHLKGDTEENEISTELALMALAVANDK